MNISIKCLPWLVFVTGACLGSFFKLVVDRYGTDESFIFKPSYCLNCKKKLSWWQNIPMVGYLLLRGKCSFCKSKIDPECFYVELITAIAALMIFQMSHTVSLLVFFMILVLLSLFDIKHRIIPHEITYLAIIIFILYERFTVDSFLIPFLNLGIVYLAMDLLHFFAARLKKYDYEDGFISLPLLIWAGMFFFTENIYLVLIPIFIYFLILKLDIPKKVHSYSWLFLFVLVLFQGYKSFYINNSYDELALFFSGIGIVYFICEILFYFIQRLFRSSSGSLKDDSSSLVAIGGGDITVLALISVFFEYKIAFFSLFIASFLALISHFILKAVGRQIPFVPFLTIACFIIILIKNVI